MANLAKSKTVFTDILKKGSAAGHVAGKNKAAITWFRAQARSFRGFKAEAVLEQKTQQRNKLTIGKMYMFEYLAKHRATLPYYDQYPLIFPIALYGDGFLGINFHYLPYQMRGILMDALYTIVSDPNLGENAKIKLSYNLLASSSKYRYFAPCIKRYLYTQLRSKFILVEPKSWDIALFLPTRQFVGETVNKVWADSRRKIANGV